MDTAKKCGFPGCWAWLDENLIRPLGPLELWEVCPAIFCSRCGAGTKAVAPIFTGDLGSLAIGGPAPTPAAGLCPACEVEHRNFLMGSRAPAEGSDFLEPSPAADGR